MQKTVRTRALTPNTQVAKKVSKSLYAFIDSLTAGYEGVIKPLFDAGVTDPSIFQSAINAVQPTSPDFDALALELTQAAAWGSAAQVDISLKRVAEGLTIKPFSIAEGGRYYDVFKAITQDTASLFKTIAPEYHEAVGRAVNASIVSGNGMQDLQPFLQSHSDGTKNYAKLRTLDQTRKAFNNLAKERMVQAGITQFEWIHTGGGKTPRVLHQKLNGKVFDIDNPPFIGVMYGQDVYGWPSDLPNCRCRMRPIILRAKKQEPDNQA
jgi:SPP1 gp7 family putative phage head morphogenesis protein